MKKTPLQQLIKELDYRKDSIGRLDGDPEMKETLKQLYGYWITKATELLKKEKEVIVDAYCCGDMDYNKVALPGTRAEEYFNETFEQ
jgi:hypothetical protein